MCNIFRFFATLYGSTAHWSKFKSLSCVRPHCQHVHMGCESVYSSCDTYYDVCCCAATYMELLSAYFLCLNKYISI